ncbi:MAG: CHAT domain-containing protein [Scytonematopsis contorta HA4267-MV1]|nr:CHAT domain-containing protein [Scytonematopsis contorta HA4267-MV1]
MHKKRLVTLMLLLALFLGTAILPSFAHLPEQKTIVQNIKVPQQLDQQGRKLYATGYFSEAITVWQQAAANFQAVGDKLQQAMVLSNLSLAYQQLSQWKEAKSAISQSLNLLENLDNPLDNSKQRSQIFAQILDVQGRLQLSLSQPEAALNTWKQATNIYSQLNDKASVNRSRINQAQALQNLGLYRQAEKILAETGQALQKEPDSSLKITGLRSLGNVLRVIGDLETSQQVLQQSLQVAQALSDSEAMGDVLLSLGNTAHAQGNISAAIKYYQQAVSISPTVRLPAQLKQLSLLLENKQISAAQALVPNIQSQINNLPTNRIGVYARINLAESLLKLSAINSSQQNNNQQNNNQQPITDIGKLLAKAVQQAKTLGDKRAESQALGWLGKVYEQNQQFSNAKDLTQQALLIAQSIRALDITYQWQWQLGRLLKQQGNNQEAIASYTEAVNSLQSLRSDLVAISSEVQFNFREEVEPAYRQLVDLLLTTSVNTGNTNNSNSQKYILKAREVIELLQLAELDNFFREACLQPQRPIDQVIDTEDPTAAAIYPIILPDRLEVILKLPGKALRHYTTMVSQSKVESTLNELRQNLTTPHTLRVAQSLSKQVYDWLIRPTEDELTKNQVKTLVFVLDGVLRNIPMAALYNGKQYLVENYSIALTPGLKLINPQRLQKQQLKAITAGVSEPRGGFSALPNVKLELAEIKSQLPSETLLNQEFTAQALQNSVGSQPFPVVHLATHGQFSSEAKKTFIVAWDKRIYVDELDNLLRTRDISQPEAIELLVLSACQTAAGDNRAALGIAGVAIRAGARSTLASLWNLDDESTALLMSQFYRELATKKIPKAEALRRAQLTLLKNPQYRRPLFWAPYVLLGNWL